MLNQNWRESRREEERLRGKKETKGAPAPRLNQQGAPGQILPQPQVWPRRQELPQQQVLIGSVPMEGVERTNAVMARPQQEAGFPARNPYAMDVDRNNRMCYACGIFGHMVKNCRNRGGNINRRMEVNNNLNGEGGLGSPN